MPADSIDATTSVSSSSAQQAGITQGVDSQDVNGQTSASATNKPAADQTVASLSDLKDKAPVIYNQVVMSLAEDCVRRMQADDDRRHRNNQNNQNS